MPYTELHQSKKAKNYVVLIMLAAFIAIIWAITMLKMSYYNKKGEEMRAQAAMESSMNESAAGDDAVIEGDIQENALPADMTDDNAQTPE